MYLTNSDTIKICWYWPDTDTDTRISAALSKIKLYEATHSLNWMEQVT